MHPPREKEATNGVNEPACTLLASAVKLGANRQGECVLPHGGAHCRALNGPSPLSKSRDPRAAVPAFGLGLVVAALGPRERAPRPPPRMACADGGAVRRALGDVAAAPRGRGLTPARGSVPRARVNRAPGVLRYLSLLYI